MVILIDTNVALDFLTMRQPCFEEKPFGGRQTRNVKETMSGITGDGGKS